MSLLVRCLDFRGCDVHKQGVWDSQMCPVYRDVLIQGVMSVYMYISEVSSFRALRVSILVRCPHSGSYECLY